MLNFKPQVYSLNPDWPHRLGIDVKIEYRLTRDNLNLFCIKVGGNVMHRDGSLEYESLPSSRTDDFITQTRFPFEEALKIANQHIPAYLKNCYEQNLRLQDFLKQNSQESWAQEFLKVIGVN